MHEMLATEFAGRSGREHVQQRPETRAQARRREAMAPAEAVCAWRTRQGTGNNVRGNGA